MKSEPLLFRLVHTGIIERHNISRRKTELDKFSPPRRHLPFFQSESAAENDINGNRLQPDRDIMVVPPDQSPSPPPSHQPAER